MHVGIDFDNTIVRYDRVFHAACVEQGLIPATVPVNKSRVRDYLRAIGKEDAWTEMQGVVYGTRMNDAEVFEGALEFFGACRERGIETFIISHKTRYPYLGERHDFHAAARAWLDASGFLDHATTGLTNDRVFFEPTKEAKLQRIAQTGCTHFIDDLPELLGAPGFPAGVVRILFDPANVHAAESTFTRVNSWRDIRNRLLP